MQWHVLGNLNALFNGLLPALLVHLLSKWLFPTRQNLACRFPPVYKAILTFPIAEAAHAIHQNTLTPSWPLICILKEAFVMTHYSCKNFLTVLRVFTLQSGLHSYAAKNDYTILRLARASKVLRKCERRKDNWHIL